MEPLASNPEFRQLFVTLVADSGIYISGDADNLGNKVALAEAADDEQTLHDVSARINAGQVLFSDWIAALDGHVVEQGGDEFLGWVPQKGVTLEQIEDFRHSYVSLVGATLTVGVGATIARTTRARLLGKIDGKDRVIVWTPDGDAHLQAFLDATPEDEGRKLRDAGFADLHKGETGPGSRGGKIIGYTHNGKPIYDRFQHPAHKNFTAWEHENAVYAHSKEWKKLPKEHPDRIHHFKQQILHAHRLPDSNIHFYIPKQYYREVEHRAAPREHKSPELDAVEAAHEHEHWNNGHAVAQAIKEDREKHLQAAKKKSAEIGANYQDVIAHAGRLAHVAHGEGSSHRWHEHLDRAAHEVKTGTTNTWKKEVQESAKRLKEHFEGHKRSK